MNGDKRRTIEM